MIPKIIDTIPKILRENINSDGQALINIIDRYIDEWKNEIILMYESNDPVICPDNQYLDELGYQLAADIKNIDSTRQKRVKIYNAVKGHKKRSLWQDDIKIRIDNITGLNSVLYLNVNNSQWIIGGGIDTIPDGYYWGSVGCNGIDNNLGLDIIGDGYEYQIKGNVWIDLGGNVSLIILDQIENEIRNIIPAYYIITLGYTIGNVFNKLRMII